MIFYSPTAFTNLYNFYRDNAVSTLIPNYENLVGNIERALEFESNVTKTNIPFIESWRESGYKQLYCKENGCFVAYIRKGRNKYVYDIIHQEDFSSFNEFNKPPNFGLGQDMSVFDGWDYYKDGNYGYGIVQNKNKQFNFLDLNGDLLVKDENDTPIWFNQLSVFYDSSGDDRLHAFADLEGYITYVYSDGTILKTKEKYSDKGINTIMEIMRRRKRVVISKRRLQQIITESIQKVLYD